MNSAIHVLYSIQQSIYQYRERLPLNSDVLYVYHRDLAKDGSVYIDIPDIPDIPEIFVLSDIRVEKGKYDVITDKRIIGEVKSVLVKKYKKITIRIYDIEDYEKLVITFDVTLAKSSIRSCL